MFSKELTRDYQVRNNSLCLLEPVDADHFFFRCYFVGRQRLKIFNSSRNFHPLNVNMLLYGNPVLTIQKYS